MWNHAQFPRHSISYKLMSHTLSFLALRWSEIAESGNNIIISYMHMGVSINRGIQKNGWFMKENPPKKDDLGSLIFGKGPIYIPGRLITDWRFQSLSSKIQDHHPIFDA